MSEKYSSNECLLCSGPVPAKQPDCYSFCLDPFSKVNNFKELCQCLEIEFSRELPRFKELFTSQRETSCDALLCTSCYPLIEDLGLMYGDLRRIQKRIDYRIVKIQQVIRRNVSVDIDNQKPDDYQQFIETFRDLVKEVDTPDTVSVVSAVTEIVAANDDSLTAEILIEGEQCQQQCNTGLSDLNPPSLDPSCVISTSEENITLPQNAQVDKKCNVCPFCSKRFQKMSRLLGHLSSHTKERPHFCKKCDKSFASVMSLFSHKKVHNSSAYQELVQPKTVLVPPSSLEMHQKIEVPNSKQFKCNLCPKSFKHSISLYEHMPLHTGEKPYQCDICQGSFGTCNALTYHVASHSGTKRYECIFCSKRFPALTNLQRHIQSKIGERWYPCDLCDKSFINAHDLKDHLKRHNNVKLYKCELCEKSFVKKHELLDHQKVHTRKKY